MAFEAKTVDEKLIQIDGKMERIDMKMDIFVDGMKKIVASFEKLENTRIADMEKRLGVLEDESAQRKGGITALKASVYILTALNVIAGLIAYFKR